MRTILLLIAVLAGGVSAQESWDVVHERALWRDEKGVLTASGEGLRFAPARAKQEEAKGTLWTWDQVQQVAVEDRAIEIVTYRDVLWQGGRDRQFRFEIAEGTGESFAALVPLLRPKLGQRLIDALATEKESAEWQVPAKLLGLIRGAEGELSFSDGDLIFLSSQAGKSRRWPRSSIETIAQTGPFSLTVTAYERALSDMGSRRSFEFQLKRPLPAKQYQALWRAIEQAHGTRLRFSETR